MKVLLTGGSGFVGGALSARLANEENINLSRAVRSASKGKTFPDVVDFSVDGIDSETRWEKHLKGVDVVVHAAARVHLMRDSVVNPLEEYRRINVGGTANLARQSLAAGVRRFVYLSSIKVNGDFTRHGQRFSAGDEPSPAGPYSRSKYEAEVVLNRLSQEGGMEIVIIRPPLVYGPGVKANFRAMMSWVHRGWPVPLGCVDNRRSLVALGNLVDLITKCITHTAAANQTFTISDDEDISSRDLVRQIGIALGKPAKLVPVPIPLIRASATLAGKRGQIERLLSSLQVDISKTRRLLGWSPVVSMNAALQATARHYLESLHP